MRKKQCQYGLALMVNDRNRVCSRDYRDTEKVLPAKFLQRKSNNTIVKNCQKF